MTRLFRQKGLGWLSYYTGALLIAMTLAAPTGVEAHGPDCCSDICINASWCSCPWCKEPLYEGQDT